MKRPPSTLTQRMGREQRALERRRPVEPVPARRAVLDAQRDLERPVRERPCRPGGGRRPAERRRRRPRPSTSTAVGSSARSAAGAGGSASRRTAPRWPRSGGRQEAHLGVQHRLARGLDHAPQLEVVERARRAGCVRGRVDDAERRRRGVLRGSRRVRIERVALPEQGVDQLLERLSHRELSPSRSATVASNVGCARSTRARSRASRVSDRTATQAVFG